MTPFAVSVLMLGAAWMLSLTAGAAGPDRDHSLREILAEAGMENPLRGDLQRPVDARLTKIESLGIAGSGLFSGKAHVVRSAAEAQALSGKLKPGDQLLLAGAEWKDASFTFAGRGTESAPILIRPEEPGSAVFSGAARLSFHGEHLVIMGIAFKDVVMKESGTVLRLGRGAQEPATACIVNRIRIEHCDAPAPADRPKVRTSLLSVRGADNTVANSVFADFKTIGQMIAAAELPPGLQRLHILGNRFANRPHLDAQNGYEIIQIGWSGENARPAGSLIQGNTFENCDGENETVTLKASDIFVRDNTFAGCQGVLCLRAANRVLVQGNVFDGQGRPDTGGVRLQGSDHVIAGNTFRRLKKPRNYYSWAVSLMAGSAEDYGDHGDVAGYGRAKNILIARNRFEESDTAIAAGIYPRPDFPLLPRNIQVRQNVFIGAAGTRPFDYLAPDPSGGLGKELRESGNEIQP